MILSFALDSVLGLASMLMVGRLGAEAVGAVVIHGSGLDGVKEPYKRYLEGTFRKHFKLKGTPLRIELRSSTNPFEGRHKPLTEKQDSMRRRRKIISKRRYG